MWSFKDGSNWELRQNEMALVEIQGRDVQSNSIVPTQLPLDKLFGFAIHPTKSSCALASNGTSYFPADFKHCPRCGVSLIHNSESAANAWIPPLGNNNSTRHFPKAIGSQADIHYDQGSFLGLPFDSSASLQFASGQFGAKSNLLIAFELVQGRLAIYSPAHSLEWVEIDAPQLESASLPAWSWRVAMSHDQSLLAIPDIGGLKWVKFDWPGLSIETVEVLQGRCMAGPAVLGRRTGQASQSKEDVLCVPMQVTTSTGEGAVLRWWRGSEAQAAASTGSQWNQIELPDVPASETFGLPVAGVVKGLLTWPGKLGVLSVNLTSDDSVSASWSPWIAETLGEQVEGLPEMGVVWRNGLEVLFPCKCEQVSQLVTRKGLVIYKAYNIVKPSATAELKLTVAKVPDPTRSDEPDLKDRLMNAFPQGPVLTTGSIACSRGFNHWETPYEESEPKHSEDRVLDDIRVPLMQFASAPREKPWFITAHWDVLGGDNSQLGLNLSSLISGEMNEKMLVCFKLRAENSARFSLQVKQDDEVFESWTVDLANLSKTAMCVFEDHLLIYVPGMPGIARWAFKSTT